MSKKGSCQTNTLFNYFQSPTNSKASTSKLENLEKDVEDTEEIIRPVKTINKKRLRDIDSDSENEEPGSLLNSNKSATSTSSFKFTKKIKKESSPTNINAGDTNLLPLNVQNGSESNVDVQWLHEKLEFLKQHNIRDGKKRKIGDPQYDPHTLYVPESYLNTLTPAMRQWWILKSKYFDTVLFFKVGKFYELYHMDAVVGVNHLGFSFMRGEFAHSGFPEIAYGRMAQLLMDQGYKVARVEQTETPEMMNERCKNKHVTKFDKVVNREVCQISTKGCCVYGSQLDDEENPLPVYMLAISEKVQDDNTNFNRSYFRTSNTTYDILRKSAGSARIEKLSGSFDFHDSDLFLQKLKEESYFKDKNGDFSWPEILCDLISDDTCKSGSELTLSALGICWWYLKESLLDIQVMTMGQFAMYQPYLHQEIKTEKEYMILDAITMENLNLLGISGTIQKTLDLCCTSFGKRLLQQWICRPLCNIEKINARQQAIQELYSNNEDMKAAQDILKKLPDLDRQIMKYIRIHTFGNKQFAEEHPDSRAVLYENKTYFKRKIMVLLNTVKGFETATEVTALFKVTLTSHVYKIILYMQTIDQKEAETHGKIIPQFGIDADYDKAEEAIQEINVELNNYLKEQCEYFGCQVNYFGSDKKRFQLEIPTNKSHKVNSEYIFEGTKKGSNPVNRYTTEQTKPFIKIENGRHPCIPNMDDYVPNDTKLGIDGKPGILILTGPNMGGKSTLMRQVALIITMAQIGSYVPASSCKMTLIDRIFTRLGAQDDIISGQSTFFVEVSEASTILQHATKQSFVLLDELGRGTSTHDGNAIATAYMKKLLEINCRVIYSTHYHTLVEHYSGRTDIQLGHMAYIIQNDDKSEEQAVTFLYKLENGVCSNSYGFNVATLAGLPDNIIQAASKIAAKLEAASVYRQLFIQLLASKNPCVIRESIRSLKHIKI
ncbi:dna mismatch repair protein muts family member [Holotrichia oblita]|uniref:Dna mismatch repair protein muts family member n=1 Tax=Holotrichia oblita TaxID=644536 RepID=A0ACB9TN59_HOLOL|nr:dna mismatch repair protein muts family member [Holotrichia oblita]